jgi:hypothetical protein
METCLHYMEPIQALTNVWLIMCDMLHKLQASMVWRSSHDTGRVLIRVNCTNCDFDVILSTQINLVKVNSSWQACYLKQSVNIRSILFWNH